MDGNGEKCPFTLDDMIRGPTPANIDRQCQLLCGQFIGGSWETCPVEVERIAGGMTNQLYRVSRKDSNQPCHSIYANDEPKIVTVKLFQPMFINSCYGDNGRLSDMFVSMIMSELAIGPKLYGVFPDGVIQSYHPHEQFRVKHQQNERLVRKVAHLIARVNHINVPIPKNPNHIMEQIKANLESGYLGGKIQSIAKEFQLPNLLHHDLMEDFVHLRSQLQRRHFPIVFCHNDFRGSNILVTEEPDRPLVLCDFEASSYGPRGYDIATLLTEWERDILDVECFGLPDDRVIGQFVQHYIEGCERYAPGYGQNCHNSHKVIVEEVKLHMLTNVMFVTSCVLSTGEAAGSQSKVIPRDIRLRFQMETVERFYKMFRKIKIQLVEQKIYLD